MNNSIRINSPGMDSSIYPDSLLVAAASLAHPGYPDVAPLIGLAHSLNHTNISSNQIIFLLDPTSVVTMSKVCSK